MTRSDRPMNCTLAHDSWPTLVEPSPHHCATLVTAGLTTSTFPASDADVVLADSATYSSERVGSHTMPLAGPTFSVVAQETAYVDVTAVHPTPYCEKHVHTDVLAPEEVSLRTVALVSVQYTLPALSRVIAVMGGSSACDPLPSTPYPLHVAVSAVGSPSAHSWLPDAMSSECSSPCCGSATYPIVPPELNTNALAVTSKAESEPGPRAHPLGAGLTEPATAAPPPAKTDTKPVVVSMARMRPYVCSERKMMELATPVPVDMAVMEAEAMDMTAALPPW